MRVLLCDDDASVRDFLRASFEVAGWDVAAVDCGERCLEAVGEGPVPDVVVLDEVMPGLQGTQVAAQLREDGFVRPIILCSAFLGAKEKRVAQKLDLIGVNKVDVQAVVRLAKAAVDEHSRSARRSRQVWPD